jgi:hypothetical protein
MDHPARGNRIRSLGPPDLTPVTIIPGFNALRKGDDEVHCNGTLSTVLFSYSLLLGFGVSMGVAEWYLSLDKKPSAAAKAKSS